MCVCVCVCVCVLLGGVLMTNSPCQPYVQCKYTSTCALAPDHLNINYTLLQRITVEFVGRVAFTSLEYCLALTRIVKVIKQLQRHSPFVDERRNSHVVRTDFDK